MKPDGVPVRSIKFHCMRLGLIAASILSLGTLLTMSAQPANSGRSDKSVARGLWGGQSLQIEVTAGGATLEFDCATGEIMEPFLLNGDGKFRVRGTFRHEAGGAIQRNRKIPSDDVTYFGEVHGRTMKLNFILPGDLEAQGPFTLTRASSGLLRKCK